MSQVNSICGRSGQCLAAAEMGGGLRAYVHVALVARVAVARVAVVHVGVVHCCCAWGRRVEGWRLGAAGVESEPQYCWTPWLVLSPGLS